MTCRYAPCAAGPIRGVRACTQKSENGAAAPPLNRVTSRVLMAVALPTAELSSPGITEIRFVSTAGLVLFVVLLGATWLGANNAIREIARERARLAGSGPAPTRCGG